MKPSLCVCGDKLTSYHSQCQNTELITRCQTCGTSGFCLEADENCACLGYHTASCGNSIPTFRDNFSFRETVSFFPETQLRNYHYCLCNSPPKKRISQCYKTYFQLLLHENTWYGEALSLEFQQCCDLLPAEYINRHVCVCLYVCVCICVCMYVCMYFFLVYCMLHCCQ